MYNLVPISVTPLLAKRGVYFHVKISPDSTPVRNESPDTNPRYHKKITWKLVLLLFDTITSPCAEKIRTPTDVICILVQCEVTRTLLYDPPLSSPSFSTLQTVLMTASQPSYSYWPFIFTTTIRTRTTSVLVKSLNPCRFFHLITDLFTPTLLKANWRGVLSVDSRHRLLAP